MSAGHSELDGRWDPYRDFARFYEVYVGPFAEDVPMYLDVAAGTRGPVIEIGAGSGRITLPLARAGHHVIAVDISRAMLARLRSRLRRAPPPIRRRVHVIAADAARLALGHTSDLIIVPYFTFNYLLTVRARDAAIRRMLAHLTPDGRIVLDVFIPLSRIARGTVGPVLRVDARDPATQARVRGWNVYQVDRHRQIETRRHRFLVETPSGRVRRHQFTTRRRYWHATELEAAFRRQGLEVERMCQGYRGRLATGDAEQLVFVLRRASWQTARHVRDRG